MRDFRDGPRGVLKAGRFYRGQQGRISAISQFSTDKNSTPWSNGNPLPVFEPATDPALQSPYTRSQWRSACRRLRRCRLDPKTAEAVGVLCVAMSEFGHRSTTAPQCHSRATHRRDYDQYIESDWQWVERSRQRVASTALFPPQ